MSRRGASLPNPSVLYDRMSEALAGPIADVVAPRQGNTSRYAAAYSPREAVVWSLHRITRNAVGPEIEREAMEHLASVRRWSRGAEKAFVAWIEIVEELVQAVEAGSPGRTSGAAKAREVREAIAGLRAADRDGVLPPDVLGITDPRGIDWTIDAVVLLLDRGALWHTDSLASLGLLDRPGLLARSARRAITPGRRAARRLARRLARVSARLERATSLPPRIGAGVAASRAFGSFGAAELDDLPRALAWFGEHREALVGGLELVYASVRLARMESELSERAQLEFANDLVITTLDEIGLGDALGPLFGTVELLVGWMVAATVAILEKRQVDATAPIGPDGHGRDELPAAAAIAANGVPCDV